MAKWTAADIPDQTGTTAVVTGANSGIGLGAAAALASHGAHTVLACRNTDKGEEAAKQIKATAPEAQIEVVRLDLADLTSVREFAKEIGGRGKGIDLLVNNAGVMALPYRQTADGFEMQFGTNHLGHFALTGLLLPHLLSTAEPRVVTVSSVAHRTGRINFGNLNGEKGYQRWLAYGQSKLANLLFTFELQRRATGTPLLSMAAHPGYTATNLQQSSARMSRNRFMEAFYGLGNVLFGQKAEIGALPTLYAATFPELPGGSYIGPDGPFEARGHPKQVGCSAAARDEQTARRLWEVSEELTGVRFPFETSTPG